MHASKIRQINYQYIKEFKYKLRNISVLNSPEFLVLLEVRETTEFIPALVSQPCGGWVSQFVLQADASSQEEHELILVQFIPRSIIQG